MTCKERRAVCKAIRLIDDVDVEHLDDLDAETLRECREVLSQLKREEMF